MQTQIREADGICEKVITLKKKYKNLKRSNAIMRNKLAAMSDELAAMRDELAAIEWQKNIMEGILYGGLGCAIPIVLYYWIAVICERN